MKSPIEYVYWKSKPCMNSRPITREQVKRKMSQATHVETMRHPYKSLKTIYLDNGDHITLYSWRPE